MRELWRRLRFLIDRDRFESDLEEEMRFHLEMKAQKSGDPHAARRQFGNPGILKEESREMWGWTWLERLWQDLRYGVRQLRLNPGFAAVAVLSLALGIGANTAIFQLVNAVRLRTLPVERPEELAYIDFAKGSMRSGWFSTRSARFTYTHWEQLRDRQEPFSGIFAWSATRFNLATGGEARYADAALGTRPSRSGDSGAAETQ